MKRIGLLSDTHGFLPEAVFSFFEHCDEIWHAGDVGNTEVLEQLIAFKTLRGVYGNIDGTELRKRLPLVQRFRMEGVKVYMVHEGGYPGRYHPRVKEVIRFDPPDLFISGHSHILKIMRDKQFGFLHINPGAAGKYGFQIFSTMVRFTLDQGKIDNVELWEKERGT